MDTSISIRSKSAGADIESWYTRYAPRLRRATRRIVGNEHDAEDATQDAFLAAFRAHARYRVQADPYPWLYRIATRKALTIAAAVHPQLEPAAVESTTPSAEDEALASDDARRLNRLIARDVPVALHLIDGLRFRDVSERLGIPPATAATRIRRGKRRLRALLAAHFTHEATPAHVQRSRTA
jgi:RNA polymerase sigma-70 factor (ECF subfamily)